MEQFYKWFDDKLQVIVVVLIISVLIIFKEPAMFNSDLVFGGLFGIGTGYAMGKLGGSNEK